MGKNFGESFSEAFLQGLESGRQAQRMRQLKEMNQMHYDATLGSKGWARMDDEDAKDYLSKLSQEGIPAIGEGYVGLPKGAKLDNGTIYDPKGKVIGEYAEGQEPQKIKNYIDQYPEGVLRVGTNFYKYDEDLAIKMGKSATPNINIDELKKNLATQGLQGSVTPSTIRVGNKTYRYHPTPEEQMGTSGIMQTPQMQPQPAPLESIQNFITPQAHAAPVQEISNAAQSATLEQYRKAVKNAIEGDENPEEILKGIQEANLNPKDFEDLLYGYEPSVPKLRRQFLGNTLRNVGVAAPASVGFMGGLSNNIDQIKNRMRKELNSSGSIRGKR